MKQWLLVASYMPAGRWMDCDEIARAVGLFGDRIPYAALRACRRRRILERRPHAHDGRRIQYRKKHPATRNR